MAHLANVTTVSHDDGAVIRPSGELDLESVHLLRDAMQEALQSSNRLVIDLSATTFLDSSVLGTLVAACQAARAAGGWLRLAEPTPFADKVLRMTKLDEVIGVFDTVADAVVGIPAADHQSAQPLADPGLETAG